MASPASSSSFLDACDVGDWVVDDSSLSISSGSTLGIVILTVGAVGLDEGFLVGLDEGFMVGIREGAIVGINVGI